MTPTEALDVATSLSERAYDLLVALVDADEAREPDDDDQAEADIREIQAGLAACWPDVRTLAYWAGIGDRVAYDPADQTETKAIADVLSVVVRARQQAARKTGSTRTEAHAMADVLAQLAAHLLGGAR